MSNLSSGTVVPALLSPLEILLPDTTTSSPSLQPFTDLNGILAIAGNWRDSLFPTSFDMSSWISRATATHHAQLVTTAVVSGVVVGGAVLGFQQARRMYRLAELKRSIPDIDDEHHATRVSEINSMAASSLTTTPPDR